MNSKDFANGLFKLAEQHKNDKRTIFDTDWNLICTEAANYILELQRQIDELEHANESWVAYTEQRAAIEEEAKKNMAERDVKFDDIVDYAAKPAYSQEVINEFLGAAGM